MNQVNIRTFLDKSEQIAKDNTQAITEYHAGKIKEQIISKAAQKINKDIRE